MNALTKKRREDAPRSQSFGKTSESASGFAPSALECDASSHRFCAFLPSAEPKPL
jgi:hypothetical protein